MAYIIKNSGGIQLITGTGADNKGLNLPVVDNASTNSTSGVSKGSLIFDDTTKQIYRFTGTEWASGAGTSGSSGTSGTSGTSVSVSGVNNYVVKFTSSTTLGTSSILDNGTSIVGGYSQTPLEGAILDGITSVLGNLKSWTSNSYSGDVLYSEISDVTLSFGQLCYRTINGKWGLADASTFGIASKSMLGICVASAPVGDPTSILINGFVTTTYVDVDKIGDPMYMKATGGEMTYTAPSGTGNVVRLIGHTFWDAGNQTNEQYILRFNPDNTWIEL
jgi:hypothetical protein